MEKRESKEGKLEQQIANLTDFLKRKGFIFDIEDVGHEIVVVVGGSGSEHHFAKMDPFPVVEFGASSGNRTHYQHLTDVIKARIMNPEGNLWETINSKEFQDLK